MTCATHVLRTLLAVTILAAGACSSGEHAVSPSTAGQRLDQDRAVSVATAGFKRDSKATGFFDSAYGWAVFPKVTKGAAGVGVASGRGQVFQGGRLIGFAKLTSVTIGPQLGGQTYSEIIFFKDAAAMRRFQAGQLTGQASSAAVVGKQGETNLADYNHGVVVMTRAQGGVILAADIGGQQFDYEPLP